MVTILNHLPREEIYLLAGISRPPNTVPAIHSPFRMEAFFLKLYLRRRFLQVSTLALFLNL